MNDHETTIFNAVYSAAATLCAKNRFVSRQVMDLTAFPAAGLWEMDSATVRNRQSTALTENYTRITWQLDVYARTKSECRKVFRAIDERMLLLNFTRVSGTFIEYPENTNVVRYTARYEAVIDADGTLYRA